MIRLDKLLADTGRYTRSDAHGLIRDGRAAVDGIPVSAPDAKVDAETQRVTIDGEPLFYSRFHYFMLDKPPDTLTATKDRRVSTVLDLLPPDIRRLGLFPVGRLDRDTTGLLLLTDDGDFAHRVISPKSGVEKLYSAEVEGILSETDVRAFAAGLTLADGTKCLPAVLALTGGGGCLVTVMEGKYHQVKRMLASRGAPVKSLRRLSIGSLQIDETLGFGGFRELTEKEKIAVLAPSGC